jgi:hypothetical protein
MPALILGRPFRSLDSATSPAGNRFKRQFWAIGWRHYPAKRLNLPPKNLKKG